MGISQDINFAVDDRRQIARLKRGPQHAWQLRLEDDILITKNIINLSATGMAFKAPIASGFKTGQPLKFIFTWAPGMEFECEGHVQWIREHDGKSGAMRQIGVKFNRLPQSLDAAIMKAIHDRDLEMRREIISRGRRPIPQQIVDSTPPTIRSAVVQLLGALLVATLTYAFAMAVWMHKQSHPEQNIANKFNDGLSRKLSGTIDPQK